MAGRPDDGLDIRERLQELSAELERVNSEGHHLEERIVGNVWKLLGAADADCSESRDS